MTGSVMIHGGNVWETEDPAMWLDFSANLRPEGPPEWVRNLLFEVCGNARYYPDRSLERATEGMAEWLGVPSAAVLPTAGGIEAIDLVLSLSTGCVRMAPFTFGEYESWAIVHDRIVDRTDRPYTAGETVFLCNPNNPTGEALSRQAVLSMREQVLEAQASLIVDEAFIHCCPENSVCRDVGNGMIVIGSLTKLLCIPGVRLGYICAAPDVISELRSRQLPWSLNAWAVEIAKALPLHAEELATEAALNRERRERFRAGLIHCGVNVRPSDASFLLADFGEDMRVCAEKLKARHILVRTCESFGLGPSFWRLSVKMDAQNDRLLQELQGLLMTQE